MPAYAQIKLKGTSGLVTYTVESDGTLLLSLDDLARAVGRDGSEHRILARVVDRVERAVPIHT